MGVERGDLIHLGHGQAHLGGERREMACVQAPVMVLQEMQVLDQKVAPPRAVAEKRPHLVLRARVDLTALRKLARPAASGAGVNAAGRLSAAVRFAARGMMNVHSSSMASDGPVIRHHSRPVVKSGGWRTAIADKPIAVPFSAPRVRLVAEALRA